MKYVEIIFLVSIEEKIFLSLHLR